MKKSHRIASFWMFSSSKIEDVSQTCFVFDVVKFKKLKKSRRIASFRMLSSSKNEDVSQNCSVSDVLMFKHDGSLAEFLCF